MNRPLALYLLILNFFLILIGGMIVYVLRNKPVLWRTDTLLSLGAMFACAFTSVIYVLFTRNSFPSPEPETNEGVIDDLAGMETPPVSALPGIVKACGVLASILALGVFGETVYGLGTLYSNGLLLPEFRSNSSLTVVVVVLLFNAMCQPWYVWRTFLNVNGPRNPGS